MRAGRVGWVLMLAALSGYGMTAGSDRTTVGAKEVPPASTAAGAGLPVGWRWESYGRVELGVPGDWAYDTAGRSWCRPRPNPAPYVGRPGAVADVGCLVRDKRVDPATLLDPGGTFVWLGAPDQARGPAGRRGSLLDPVPAGDRDTFVAGGVVVAIQAPVGLRRAIRSTVRLVTRDHNGCGITSPFVGDPAWRPPGPAVTALTGVSTVSACEYSGGGLVSSLRVDGAPARAAIAAVADAPVGGGPNVPADSCLPDHPATDDLILLQIGSAEGLSRIVLRYGGCFHHGLDDGTSIRALTRPAVAPFVGGPNRITVFSGADLIGILTS